MCTKLIVIFGICTLCVHAVHTVTLFLHLDEYSWTVAHLFSTHNSWPCLRGPSPGASTGDPRMHTYTPRDLWLFPLECSLILYSLCLMFHFLALATVFTTQWSFTEDFTRHMPQTVRVLWRQGKWLRCSPGIILPATGPDCAKQGHNTPTALECEGGCIHMIPLESYIGIALLAFIHLTVQLLYMHWMCSCSK